jgi:RNA polymerase primary sigma factor
MPRTATATSQAYDDEATMTHVDELIQHGRSQGHLSLPELRVAFEQAQISPTDARSIVRELTDAGVQLGNDPEAPVQAPGTTGDDTVLDDSVLDETAADSMMPDDMIPDDTVPDPDDTVTGTGAPGGTRPGRTAAGRSPARGTGRGSRQRAESAAPAAADNAVAVMAEVIELDGLEAEASALAASTVDLAAEADLDDQTSVMGDSVHTYLKSIGRTSLLTAEQEVDLAKRIEAGLFAENKLETETGLSRDYRRDLEDVAEDGHRAKAHMLEANLRLVVSVAKKYSDRGLSLLDVVQEGNLGLIRAVEKFDYTKGYKFSTYAMWWIRQAIQRGFADSARTIRLPVHVLEMLSKLSRVERDMHQRLGREPTPEELAVELDRTPDQIEELLRTSRQPISLDSTIGEDGETSIGDLIEDVDAPEASELVDRQLLADQLRHALDALTPREATIMAMRFGLYDGNPHTLDEIGRALGLTRERIRQLEKQSLSKLRHPSRAQPLLDYAS